MKSANIANVEVDRKEIAKNMAEFENDKYKKKQADEEKRIHIMEMM